MSRPGSVRRRVRGRVPLRIRRRSRRSLRVAVSVRGAIARPRDVRRSFAPGLARPCPVTTRPPTHWIAPLSFPVAMTRRGVPARVPFAAGNGRSCPVRGSLRRLVKHREHEPDYTLAVPRRPRARYSSGPIGCTKKPRTQSTFGPRTSPAGRRIRSRRAIEVTTNSAMPPRTIAFFWAGVKSSQRFFCVTIPR